MIWKHIQEATIKWYKVIYYPTTQSWVVEKNTKGIHCHFSHVYTNRLDDDVHIGLTWIIQIN